jgi:chromosome segregation ATPase
MVQNVLRTVGEDGQSTEDEADSGFARDARGLLGHLNSALATSAEADALAADNVPPVITQAAPQAPNFGRAVARQAEQIQFLVEQIDRLDRDTQVVELREIVRALHGTLGDVALRMQQNSSEITAKIGLLMGAVTIIGSAPDLDKPHDITAVLDSAKAAAERLVSLEGLARDASAAIAALEGSAFRGQTAVRDLSEDLAKLNQRAEADRKEITGVRQQIESADAALAQRLAKVNEAIESDRKEAIGLQRRLDATDHSLTTGLAKVDDAIEAERNEIVQLQRRIAATDQAVAEIDSWKVQSSERSARLMGELEALERKTQALTQEREQTAARLQAMEQALAAMAQRQNALSAWHDRIAHVLSTKPE